MGEGEEHRVVSASAQSVPTEGYLGATNSEDGGRACIWRQKTLESDLEEGRWSQPQKTQKWHLGLQDGSAGKVLAMQPELHPQNPQKGGWKNFFKTIL